jgi:proteasome lid subunit RPN8/RPN11
MSTRTVVKRGSTWSVDDLADGTEEWVRVSGSDAGEFRTNGPGSCAVVDRGRSARAVTRARPAVASSSGRRTKRVVLTAQARQQIIEELCGWEDGPHEARETAGFLVGRFDGSTIVVTAAFGPGPEAARNYGQVTLDMGYMDSIRNALLPGERIVGDFHSHPRPSRSSAADERVWASLAKRGAGKWLGLIATRKGTDWAYPEFTAYLSRGEARAEQIAIEEERWQ